MYLPLIKPTVTVYKPFIKGSVLVGLTGTFNYSNNPYNMFELHCLAYVHICHIFLCLSMCACECNFARARLGALLLVYVSVWKRNGNGSSDWVGLGLWRERQRGTARVGLLPASVWSKEIWPGWNSKTATLHLSSEVWFNNQQQRRGSMSGKTKSKEDKDHAAKREWWWTPVRYKEGCNYTRFFFLYCEHKSENIWCCDDAEISMLVTYSHCPHNPENWKDQMN